MKCKVYGPLSPHQVREALAAGLGTTAATTRNDTLTQRRLPQCRPMSEVVRSIDEAKRTVEFLASDETVDRMGDILRADGWNLKDYNGAFLWAHNAEVFPLGRSIRHGIQDLGGGRRGLVQLIEFAQHPAADLAWRLYVGGFLRSVSVGFLPRQTVWIEDPVERQRLGLGQWGVVYAAMDLLELSGVNVPANPAANVLSAATMVKRGLLTKKDLDVIGGGFDPFGGGAVFVRSLEEALARASTVVPVPAVEEREGDSEPDAEDSGEPEEPDESEDGGGDGKPGTWATDGDRLVWFTRDASLFEEPMTDHPLDGHDGVSVRAGKLKNGGSTEVCAVVFDASAWTKDTAGEWLRTNQGVLDGWKMPAAGGGVPPEENPKAAPEGLTREHAQEILDAVHEIRAEVRALADAISARSQVVPEVSASPLSAPPAPEPTGNAVPTPFLKALMRGGY